MNNEVNPSSPGVVTAHGLCRVRLGLWLSSLCLKWEDENTAEAQDLPPGTAFWIPASLGWYQIQHWALKTPWEDLKPRPL